MVSLAMQILIRKEGEIMEIRLEEQPRSEKYSMGTKIVQITELLHLVENLTSDQPFSESLFIRKKNAMPSSIL